MWRFAAVALVATTACGRLDFETAAVVVPADGAPDTTDAIVTLPVPVGWWKLDETTGTTAADASGHGLSGTVMGAATWAPGKFGNGIALDGSTTEFVSIADTASLRLSGSWTLSLWVKLTTAPANTQMYTLAAKTDAMGFETYSLRLDNNYGQFGSTGPGSFVAQFATAAGVDVYTLFTPATIDVGQWISVLDTWNAQTGVLQLYVNGQPLASTTNLSAMPTTVAGQPFLIGDNAGHTDQGTAGTLDDVRIYDVALSPAEVALVYAGG